MTGNAALFQFGVKAAEVSDFHIDGRGRPVNQRGEAPHFWMRHARTLKGYAAVQVEDDYRLFAGPWAAALGWHFRALAALAGAGGDVSAGVYEAAGGAAGSAVEVDG